MARRTVFEKWVVLLDHEGRKGERKEYSRHYVTLNGWFKMVD